MNGLKENYQRLKTNIKKFGTRSPLLPLSLGFFVNGLQYSKLKKRLSGFSIPELKDFLNWCVRKFTSVRTASI